MHRHLLAVLLMAGGATWAGSGVSYLKDASELLEEEGGSCERKVGSKLENAIDAMKELQKEGGRSARREAKRALEKLTDAVEEHCKGKVASKISKLVAKAERKLDDADDEDRDDRAERRRDRDDDEDDRPAPRSNGVQVSSGGFTLSMGGSTSATSSNAAASNGRYPMSGSAYQSFLQALQANRNEILKKDTAISTLQRNYVSARQLGGVLDQFNNEILKMDVAKAARVTDPGNALGLSSKFRNSIYQSEFVEVMNQQQ